MISIIKDTIDQLKILEELKDNSSGAVVFFTGIVRDHNSKEKVEGIFYEAYEEMVNEILKKIENEVFKNWNIKKFIAIHRIGYLKVGEISVIVGVSSEHRKEAFEACSYGIDNIKKRCPIWKKEKMESGDSEWVEGVMINE
ncbi:MAG TPA: molybdenum cofactor biosynthesis protein MoaE [Nitrososphaeraceae archaeon]|jgi:molybdopterin synthase catalytic subunit|nr:molybdenum cofactor biosynthesis protein MoaE [Nitrososphaeraceae archaeon]